MAGGKESPKATIVEGIASLPLFRLQISHIIVHWPGQLRLTVPVNGGE
jgi:hypothetical protein